MGCAGSKADPSLLVAQTAPANSIVANGVGAQVMELSVAHENVRMTKGAEWIRYKVADAPLVSIGPLAGLVCQGEAKVLPISGADGKQVAAIYAGEPKDYMRGRGRSVLYATVGTDGASGHESKFTADGTPLHAVGEIRPLGDGKSFTKGEGFYPAGPDGGFAAEPALIYKGRQITTGKGEVVGLPANMLKTKWLFAAGVDVVTLIALREEYTNAEQSMG